MHLIRIANGKLSFFFSKQLTSYYSAFDHCTIHTNLHGCWQSGQVAAVAVIPTEFFVFHKALVL